MSSDDVRPNVGPRVRCLLALLALGCAIGAGWVVSLVWTPLQRGVAAWTWPEAEAEVLTAHWHEERVPETEDATRSWLALTYAYTIDEPTGYRDHRVSTRFDANSPNQHSRNHQNSIAARGMGLCAVSAAPHASVRVDPSDPDFAVLQAGVPFGTAILLLVSVLLAGCAFGFGRVAYDGHAVLGQTPSADTANEKSREAEFLIWAGAFSMGGLLLATLGAYVFEWGMEAPLPGWPLAIYGVIYGLALPLPRLLATRLVTWLSVGLLFTMGGLLASAFPIAMFADRADVEFTPDQALLVERLRSDHPDVLTSAAYEVRNRDAPAAAEPLLVEALEHPSERVRKAAKSALVELRNASGRHSR